VLEPDEKRDAAIKSLPSELLQTSCLYPEVVGCRRLLNILHTNLSQRKYKGVNKLSIIVTKHGEQMRCYRTEEAE
jgi:hypothetical protein